MEVGLGGRPAGLPRDTVVYNCRREWNARIALMTNGQLVALTEGGKEGGRAVYGQTRATGTLYILPVVPSTC